MRSLFWLAMLAMPLVLTGCYSTTCDGRGPSDECQVHHEFMREEIVSNRRLPMPSQEYMLARLRFFPHSYPFALPDQCGKCLVYICDDCAKAEKEWQVAHPGER